MVSDRIDDANSIESVSNVISSVTNNPDQIPLDFQVFNIHFHAR